jgi:hypothetical protein
MGPGERGETAQDARASDEEPRAPRSTVPAPERGRPRGHASVLHLRLASSYFNSGSAVSGASFTSSVRGRAFSSPHVSFTE